MRRPATPPPRATTDDKTWGGKVLEERAHDFEVIGIITHEAVETCVESMLCPGTMWHANRQTDTTSSFSHSGLHVPAPSLGDASGLKEFAARRPWCMPRRLRSRLWAQSWPPDCCEASKRQGRRPWPPASSPSDPEAGRSEKSPIIE